MKIPETAQKQTEDIAIGSGYMYIKDTKKAVPFQKYRRLP